MFYISLSETKDYSGYGVGYMAFGQSKENFRSSLDCWQVADYEKQWSKAISRLIDGAESSVLITSLPALASDDMIELWPMWRNDDTVYIQEEPLFSLEAKNSFDPNNPYVHIGPHLTELEDGERISEWNVPLQDFVDFIRSAPKKFLGVTPTSTSRG